MIPLIFELNKVLNRSKILWYGPAILFLLVLVSRLYNLYVITAVVWFLGVLIALFSIFSFIKNIFVPGDDLKYEVILYKKLGIGFFRQYLLKLMLTILFTLIFYSLFAFIKWSFDWRVLVVVICFSSFLFFMRVAGVYAKTKAVYYSSLILIAISIFFPLYVLPNLAYILNANANWVVIYSATYFLLYLLAGFIFFVSAWRNECIGWM